MNSVTIDTIYARVHFTWHISWVTYTLSTTYPTLTYSVCIAAQQYYDFAFEVPLAMFVDEEH